jgi:hypothetical protein
MVKVKLTQTVHRLRLEEGTAPVDKHKGDVVDVPKDLAAAMVNSGQAERVGRGPARTGPSEAR